jgi:hypothetical protein
MSKPPKIFETLSIFFPIVHLAFALLLSTTVPIILTVLWIYFLPPLSCRLFLYFYPIKIGASVVGKSNPEGSSWLIAHHMQKIFDCLPLLEGCLKLIPGVYSFWLRSWGAKIGKKVQWTPECRIVDRTLIQIGDRCLVGNMSYIAAHALKKKDGRYLLYCKPVQLGADVVLSYRSTVSPGCVLGDKAFVEAGASLYPGQKLETGQSYTRSEELKHVME